MDPTPFAGWTPAVKSRFAKALLAWFKDHARDLPWRQTADPYAIWVSEIMLQQTQVATVRPYFVRFMRRFPTVTRLAAASVQEVLQLWEGLGYYRRAHQLHAAARQIVRDHAGEVPTAANDFLRLPGIGRYTAGAVLSISQGQRLPILEANTARLFSRLLARSQPTAQTDSGRVLWQFAEQLLPAKNCGHFNQALMELGSLVCTPTAPRCTDCPVRAYCGAAAHGQPEAFPAKNPRPKTELVTEAAVVVVCKKRLLLLKAQAGGRWAGMWNFPRFPLRGEALAEHRQQVLSAFQSQLGFNIRLDDCLTTITHQVTRFRISLLCFQAAVLTKKEPPLQVEHQWVTRPQLSEIALPKPARALAQWLQTHGG